MSKKKRSQQTERRFMSFRDQHNRVYAAWTENMTGDPCTPLMAQFTAPIMPPETYIEVRDELGPRRVWINYRRWFDDARAQWKDRAIAAIRFAKELHGNSSAKIDPINPPADILHRLGEPPIRLELVAAMAQGNPWVLGFSKTPDVRLEPLLPTKVLVQDTVSMDSFDFGALVTEEGGAAVAGPVPSFDLGELAAFAEGSFSFDNGLEVVDRDAPKLLRKDPNTDFFDRFNPDQLGELLDGDEMDLDGLDDAPDPLADEDEPALVTTGPAPRTRGKGKK